MNSAAMNFKFLVRDIKQDRTTTLKVVADREQVARRELQMAGFQPIALVGVEALKDAQIEIKNSNSLTGSSQGPRSSGNLHRMRVKFSSMVSDFFAPFSLLA